MSLAFNATFYLQTRPDVFNAFIATAGATGQSWAEFAQAHYNTFGRFEGSNPNAIFNTVEYLQANTDVAAAGVNPFDHYLSFGVNEGRAPSATFIKLADFDSAAYLAANEDLGAAGITTPEAAYAHFVQFGQFESRPGTPASVTPAVPGQTFTLTISQDTLTGTANDDIFLSGAAQDGNSKLINTLQNVDVINGGAGNDRLDVTLAEAAAVAATIQNIETINARFADAGADLDLANTTGTTTVNAANSTTAGTISNVGSIANLGVRGQNQAVTFTGNTATALSFNFDTVGKSTAAADEIVVKAATGATSASVTLNKANVDVQTLASVETLTVVATGANRLDMSASAGAIKTATVSGDGSVNLAAAFTALTKLDGAANKGGITATVDAKAKSVTTGEGKDSISYTEALAADTKVDLGAGDDTFTIAAASAASARVDGGTGANTLKVTNGTFLNADAAKVYTNFQTLEVGGGTGTYNLDNLPGITAVTVGADLGGATTISNAAAGTTLAFNAAKDTDLAAGTISYALKDATGKADTVSVSLNALDDGKGAAAKGVVTVASLTANAIETITINSTVAGISSELKNTDYTNTITKLTADAAATIVVTGNANLTVTDDATSFAAITKIDASAATGKVSFDATGAAQSVQFIGGAAADTFTASGKGDTINGGKGADIITLAAGADTVILNAGDSILNDKGSAHDKISTFATGDTIDLGAFAFTGQQSSAIANKGALAAVADVLALATSVQTGFFEFGGVARGVATHTAGGNTYVFVDVNKDGNFDAATDLVVELSGIGVVALGDFGF